MPIQNERWKKMKWQDFSIPAIIGEAGAEAVIPLDGTLEKYLSRAMQNVGGGDITVNFYPKQMTNGELDRAFNYINRRFGTAY